jgi:hypothetical protein|tara:strand:- start:323 stop:487 length:165 start_codon:yes stop_codon:yes gene_type:complete
MIDMRKFEIVVDAQDLKVLESAFEGLNPWDADEAPALLRLLKQIVAKNDTNTKS